MQKRPGLRQPGRRNFRPPNAVGHPPNELEPWFKGHPHLAPRGPRGPPVQWPAPSPAHVSQRQPARYRLPNGPFHHPRQLIPGHAAKNTSPRSPDNKDRKSTFTSTKSTSHVNSKTGKTSVVVDNSPFTRPERNELWGAVGFAYLWRNFENAKGNELVIPVHHPGTSRTNVLPVQGPHPCSETYQGCSQLLMPPLPPLGGTKTHRWW